MQSHLQSSHKEHAPKSEHVLFSLSHVSFSYGHKPVLRDVSFTISCGELIGIVGPNGGGKTTVIKLLTGLISPNSGKIVRANDLKIGYVAQKSGQVDVSFPASVTDIVELGLAMQPACKHQEQKIHDALQIVDMAPFAKRRFSSLSGGQQQRVLIAKALVSSPDVLILDEPTVGVDAKNQKNFYALLSALHKSRGITVIMVSHDHNELAQSVRRVIAVNEKITYDGSSLHYTDGGHHHD